ncbi:MULTISPECIES: hypothetical protein [Sphingomonas]|uniref:Lipoprotein n=1 Tax=Sphingomonas bisphenolicum TaxID=296544 RepID=A0ABM7G030_9SPHN|nr:hypothetical protein [Sphingomonas bisphenolicum]MBA4092213.1 hypothetical protein [Sphingobium sp.]BBF68600.1 hypothetical protein SBA_ch1_08000 [Sphingomonas bisphenolicum]
MRGWIGMAPLLLAACTGSYEPTPLTDKQATKLDKALAGKVAGEKVSCINREPQTNLTVISNNVLLYKVNRKLVYKNDLIGSCSGLTYGDTMIVRSYGSQMCRGDFTTTANLQTGITTGACALGDFIPYRAPKP